MTTVPIKTLIKRIYATLTLEEYRLKSKIHKQELLLIAIIEKLEQLTKKEKQLQRLAIATTKQSVKSRQRSSKKRAQRKADAKLRSAKNDSHPAPASRSSLSVTGTKEIEEIHATSDFLRTEVARINADIQKTRHRLGLVSWTSNQRDISTLVSNVDNQITRSRRVFGEIERTFEQPENRQYEPPSIEPLKSRRIQDENRFEQLVKIRRSRSTNCTPKYGGGKSGTIICR